MPNLTTCPDCGKEVSSRAQSCPHCGAPIAPQSVQVEEPKKEGYGAGCMAIAVVSALLFFGLIFVLNSGGPSKQSSPSHPPSATVAASMIALRIENTGAEDWRSVKIWINGVPYGDTLKAERGFIPAGGSVEIPLIEFVSSDGSRYRPMEQSVSYVWVHPSGFDARRYDF